MKRRISDGDRHVVIISEIDGLWLDSATLGHKPSLRPSYLQSSSQNPGRVRQHQLVPSLATLDNYSARRLASFMR